MYYSFELWMCVMNEIGSRNISSVYSFMHHFPYLSFTKKRLIHILMLLLLLVVVVVFFAISFFQSILCKFSIHHWLLCSTSVFAAIHFQFDFWFDSVNFVRYIVASLLHNQCMLNKRTKDRKNEIKSERKFRERVEWKK